MTHREPWRVSTKNGLDSHRVRYSVMTGQEIVPVSGSVPGGPTGPEAPAPAVQPVPPPVVAAAKTKPASNRLRAFADVPFHLTVEIGRLRVSVQELLQLKAGKVFRIGKAAGEPFDICANGQPVARGEVVLVENSSGVRITEIAKL